MRFSALRPALVVFVVVVALVRTSHAAPRWLQSATIQGRRWLNFGSTFGSAVNSATVYDRIAGHPVFAVTTSWGSPYLNMEKLVDLDETIPETTVSKTSKTLASISDEQNEIRMVALYYLDPADAIATHGEMKQMEQMKQADIRVTTFSLAKALRQASNLGGGLTTGQPPDATTGQFTEQGTLRYKLVPSKKQLFYAARCIGRQRVGLCSDSANEDAALAITGNSALDAANLLRRRQKAESKFMTDKGNNVAPHMEGYTGVPIFYSPSMQRRPPILKRILTGVAQEKVFFFNYEDLQMAWNAIRDRKNPKDSSVLQDVEVFNLWDVLSSMDRQQLPARTSNHPLKSATQYLFRPKPAARYSLLDITFVPNSDAVQYKDSISRRGNGKARLRPMR